MRPKNRDFRTNSGFFSTPATFIPVGIKHIPAVKLVSGGQKTPQKKIDQKKKNWSKKIEGFFDPQRPILPRGYVLNPLEKKLQA